MIYNKKPIHWNMLLQVKDGKTTRWIETRNIGDTIRAFFKQIGKELPSKVK
jgi:hypothetical protein